jgi:hypothetical protein
MLREMKWVIAVLAIVFAADAAAQGMPRRDRGGSPRENRDPPKAAPIAPGDPFSALERELPSLEVDLLLKPQQLDAWRAFARDVRDLAEMDRSRRKHLMSLRDQTASNVIATLAEDERMKSEATAELKRHFDQLYSALDDAQRRTLDRRVVLSQVEPLGR